MPDPDLYIRKGPGHPDPCSLSPMETKSKDITDITNWSYIMSVMQARNGLFYYYPHNR